MEELPRSTPLQERPQLTNIPYRNSMAGSMMYLGMPPTSKETQRDGAGDIQRKGAIDIAGCSRSHEVVPSENTPAEKIVAWDDGCDDLFQKNIKRDGRSCEQQQPRPMAQRRSMFDSVAMLLLELPQMPLYPRQRLQCSRSLLLGMSLPFL